MARRTALAGRPENMAAGRLETGLPRAGDEAVQAGAETTGVLGVRELLPAQVALGDVFAPLGQREKVAGETPRLTWWGFLGALRH